MRCLSSAPGADCPLLVPVTSRTTSAAFAASRRSLMSGSSAGRLQRASQQVHRDLLAHLLTDLERVPEMDPAPNAHHALLLCHLSDAGELASQAWVYRIGRCDGGRPGPEHGFENGRGRAGLDGRLRWVFG